MLRNTMFGLAAALMCGVCFAPETGAGAGGGADPKPRKELIADAVARLDPANDDHWTRSGLPKTEAIDAILKEDGTGTGGTVTRAEVNDAATGFERPAKAAEVEADPAADGEVADNAPAEGDRMDDPMTSTAEREMRATRPAAAPEGGVDSGELLDTLEDVFNAASHPKFTRNQGLQQLVTLWRQQGATIKVVQKNLDDRTERRREDRAERREAREAEATA